jgi:LysR family transcriptional regulator, nitrogen assimilation regulatory protein
MEYAAWKLFVDAAELGSLSKVALAYGTSQPHISRRIGELEQECGGRLFQRTGRGVELTELGQRIAPKVRAWLTSTDQLANDVRSSAGTPIGKVRIGSLPSTAHPLVSTLHKRLKERYPLIQLSVREGQGAQLETWLEDGSVDLAILYRTSTSPKNGDTYLVETSTYLVSAAGDPLTSRPTVRFSALHNLPLVLFCRPSSWRNQLEQISAERKISLNVALEADSLSLQTHIVSEGGVYALLGPYAIAAASKDRPLQSSKLVDPVVTRHIALAMSRHGTMTLACRTVMQMARDIAKSGVAALRTGRSAHARA